MNTLEKPTSSIFPWLGGSLVVVGLVIALEQRLHTGWLILALLPAFGILLLSAGWRKKSMAWLLPGLLIIGLGLGLLLGYSPIFKMAWMDQLGALLITFAAGWVAIGVVPVMFHKNFSWWAFIPAGIIGGAGVAFAFTPLRFLDFILYPCMGLGIALLLWGIMAHLFGLIISGALVFTTGPAIYMGWINPGQPLSQTGVMLVILALGWILITVFSRAVTHKFVWWPLIPGGVLGMVGWGLYIGGNPGNAISFIGNTGSVALIILGIYLLLIRRGMRQ